MHSLDLKEINSERDHLPLPLCDLSLIVMSA